MDDDEFLDKDLLLEDEGDAVSADEEEDEFESEEEF